MRVGKSRSSSTYASLGSSKGRASPAPSWCRCAKSPHASMRSTRRGRSSPSATTAAAASRLRYSSRKTATTTCITSRGASMPGREPSIRRYRFIKHWAWALAAVALPAAAEDLLQVFRDAQRYDAVYSSARYALEAGRERIPQARALLLPALNLTANVAAQRLEQESTNPLVTPSFVRSPTLSGYTFTLSQPVFRPQNLVQRDQADYQVRQAEATFGQAAQDLAVRSGQAYFDVLAARDTLALVGAQKAAR